MRTLLNSKKGEHLNIWGKNCQKTITNSQSWLKWTQSTSLLLVIIMFFLTYDGAIHHSKTEGLNTSERMCSQHKATTDTIEWFGRGHYDLRRSITVSVSVWGWKYNALTLTSDYGHWAAATLKANNINSSATAKGFHHWAIFGANRITVNRGGGTLLTAFD